MAKCAKCSKAVTKKSPGVQCNKCSKWYHGSCASLTAEQLTALSSMESVDWKCRVCSIAVGGKGRRISVILPDPDDEESDVEGIANQQDKTLFEIHQEVRQLRQNVKDIIRDELQNTLKFYSNKIDEYEEKVKSYEMRVKIMENQCKNLNDICTNLTLKNEVLEQKLSKLEQAQSYNELEICGMEEQQNEDIKNIVTTYSQLLKQNPDDIIKAVRRKKPIHPGTAQAERLKVDAPIMISLREGRREQWYEAARTVNVTSKDLGGESGNKVYLREALSPTISYLLWKTKTNLKEKALCKYVWCRNGQIMVRKKKVIRKYTTCDPKKTSSELAKNCGKQLINK
ncbi:unnamed protein product [Spodoptera littoralis]|uniref:PHD-type domain-containing protein n=1 Tax=Spodoptera littoralis TaxID=7109 RepID=A0A9P0IH24_SPOLI|nr:unnamed protein product [Spodoptera littoralis]CAH1645687.1 unnamed protein product [Spodoptera littoralis]